MLDFIAFVKTANKVFTALQQHQLVADNIVSLCTSTQQSPNNISNVLYKLEFRPRSGSYTAYIATLSEQASATHTVLDVRLSVFGPGPGE
jgi:hypothetical protein